MSRHPWQVSLRELLERLRQLGFQVRTATGPVFGPHGDVYFRFLESSEQAEAFAVLFEIEDEDEILPPSVVRSILGQLGVPPDLLQLDLPETDSED